MATGPLRDLWVSLLDSLGNAITGANPLPTQVVAGGTGAADQATGTLTAVAQTVVLTNTIGAGSVSFQLFSAAFTGTVQYEVSDDGTNWDSAFACEFNNGNSSGTASGFGGSVNRTFTVTIGGALFFRVRCSAYTSGTLAVTIADGTANSLISLVNSLSGLAAINNPSTLMGVASYLLAQNATVNERLMTNAGGPTIANRLAMALGTGVMTSLNAVAAPANGTSFNMGVAHMDFGMEVLTTGSPTTLNIELQGSLAGAVWTKIGTAFTTTAGGYAVFPGAPVTQIRAVLVTLAGGTAPTVTARICAR